MCITYGLLKIPYLFINLKELNCQLITFRLVIIATQLRVRILCHCFLWWFKTTSFWTILFSFFFSFFPLFLYFSFQPLFVLSGVWTLAPSQWDEQRRRTERPTQLGDVTPTARRQRRGEEWQRWREGKWQETDKEGEATVTRSISSLSSSFSFFFYSYIYIWFVIIVWFVVQKNRCFWFVLFGVWFIYRVCCGNRFVYLNFFPNFFDDLGFVVETDLSLSWIYFQFFLFHQHLIFFSLRLSLLTSCLTFSTLCLSSLFEIFLCFFSWNNDINNQFLCD